MVYLGICYKRIKEIEIRSAGRGGRQTDYTVSAMVECVMVSTQKNDNRKEEVRDSSLYVEICHVNSRLWLEFEEIHFM